jgi:hypothetical protein
MTDTDIELSEDAFDALFPLRPNHLNPNATWGHQDEGGCLFETYGDELAFVKQQDARTVWTFMDDDNGRPCVVSGFHFVSRIGYLVSALQTPVGVNIHVRLDPLNDDDMAPATRRVMKAERVIADYGLGNELENLTDLLTDARHWCDEHSEDFAKLDGLAYRHYVAELNHEED